jgi:hypothetical protein
VSLRTGVNFTKFFLVNKKMQMIHVLADRLNFNRHMVVLATRLPNIWLDAVAVFIRKDIFSVRKN